MLKGKKLRVPYDCSEGVDKVQNAACDKSVVQPVENCFFPACSRDTTASPFRIEIELGLVVEHKLPRNDRSRGLVVLRGSACEEHSNLVKGRKQKKKMCLQQYSHMRNALLTVMTVINKSLKNGLADVCPLTVL